VMVVAHTPYDCSSFADLNSHSRFLASQTSVLSLAGILPKATASGFETILTALGPYTTQFSARPSPCRVAWKCTEMKRRKRGEEGCFSSTTCAWCAQFYPCLDCLRAGKHRGERGWGEV